MKGLVNLSCVKYINEVLVRMSMVSVCSCILPCLIYFNMHCSFIRLFLVCVVSVVSLLTFMYLLGLEKSERAFMMNKLNDLLSNINKDEDWNIDITVAHEYRWNITVLCVADGASKYGT